ncbi:uncharacterized protein STEHIDRAFT_152536 [Stereum hirsutum FP-91666 SS1]|uniref:uncharacterized protein n=1 Tax=Stereum hirsutum (strain FP-91666) TaxID=721885 RepID=UPI000440D62A|nr:uncharacterized protein STEHIDRAFT_152536 [Stereum hirsutum FP-91666 SS1]EIM90843.1 hypothetical protein STEHIDRAFT_152536 [Stereum hirsutum FP-91666 SS1]
MSPPMYPVHPSYARHRARTTSLSTSQSQGPHSTHHARYPAGSGIYGPPHHGQQSVGSYPPPPLPILFHPTQSGQIPPGATPGQTFIPPVISSVPHPYPGDGRHGMDYPSVPPPFPHDGRHVTRPVPPPERSELIPASASAYTGRYPDRASGGYPEYTLAHQSQRGYPAHSDRVNDNLSPLSLSTLSLAHSDSDSATLVNSPRSLWPPSPSVSSLSGTIASYYDIPSRSPSPSVFEDSTNGRETPQAIELHPRPARDQSLDEPPRILQRVPQVMWCPCIDSSRGVLDEHYRCCDKRVPMSVDSIKFLSKRPRDVAPGMTGIAIENGFWVSRGLEFLSFPDDLALADNYFERELRRKNLRLHLLWDGYERGVVREVHPRQGTLTKKQLAAEISELVSSFYRKVARGERRWIPFAQDLHRRDYRWDLMHGHNGAGTKQEDLVVVKLDHRGGENWQLDLRWVDPTDIQGHA